MPHKNHDPIITTNTYPLYLASTIAETENTKFPEFDVSKLKQMWRGKQCWDNWAVRDKRGILANVGGFTVLIALSRPQDASFSEANRVAYFYSKDGVNYKPGGFLFGDKQVYKGVSEWSGSTILRDDGKIQTWYTIADGINPEGIWQTRQRLATAIQEFEVVGDELVIKEPIFHELLHGASEPDGSLYERPEDSAHKEKIFATRHDPLNGSMQTDNNCDRDPFYYFDEESGESYLIFEGNTGKSNPSGVIKNEYLGFSLDDYDFSPTEDMLKANGCIGVIRLANAEGTYGQRLKPWLVFNLVTDECERINLIKHDGYLYLFTVVHGNKMTTNADNPDMINRDFMLGFRTKHLFGQLEPLNGNGVVVQQKSLGAAYSGQMENQQYVYSWLLVPDEKSEETGEFRCLSYANYCMPIDGGEAKGIMNAGPSVKVKINGGYTEIVDLMYDIIPSSVEVESGVLENKENGDKVDSNIKYS